MGHVEFHPASRRWLPSSCQLLGGPGPGAGGALAGCAPAEPEALPVEPAVVLAPQSQALSYPNGSNLTVVSRCVAYMDAAGRY